MPEPEAMNNGSGQDAREARGVTASMVPCDFRHAERLDPVQERTLRKLNENFARSMARALASLLRINADCTLLAVEQSQYRGVLAHFPELTYIARFGASTDDSSCLMQLDLDLAFPMIDLLLGGEGTPAGTLRELTEIEEEILGSVASLICDEMMEGWKPLGATFEFKERQSGGQLTKLMPPDERTLVLTFEVATGEVKGKLVLIFPGLLSASLLRRAAHDSEYQRPATPNSGERMRELLMDCSFEFDLSFRQLMLPAAELLTLAPGNVLALRCGVEQLGTASITDVPLFGGHAARSGDQRAAQILGALPVKHK